MSKNVAVNIAFEHAFKKTDKESTMGGAVVLESSLAGSAVSAAVSMKF